MSVSRMQSIPNEEVVSNHECLKGAELFLSIKLDTEVCSSSMLVDTLYKIWSGIFEF